MDKHWLPVLLLYKHNMILCNYVVYLMLELIRGYELNHYDGFNIASHALRIELLFMIIQCDSMLIVHRPRHNMMTYACIDVHWVCVCSVAYFIVNNIKWDVPLLGFNNQDVWVIWTRCLNTDQCILSLGTGRLSLVIQVYYGLITWVFKF